MTEQPIHDACDIIYNELFKMRDEVVDMERTSEVKIYNIIKERININEKLLLGLREKALREEREEIV